MSIERAKALNKAYLNKAEVRDALGISRSKLHHLIKTRQLKPAFRIGKLPMFSLESILAFAKGGVVTYRASNTIASQLDRSTFEQAIEDAIRDQLTYCSKTFVWEHVEVLKKEVIQVKVSDYYTSEQLDALREKVEADKVQASKDALKWIRKVAGDNNAPLKLEEVTVPCDGITRLEFPDIDPREIYPTEHSFPIRNDKDIDKAMLLDHGD